MTIIWNVSKKNELYHYGVKGMKWGVRRYQPYPNESRHHYKVNDVISVDKSLNKEDVRTLTGGNDSAIDPKETKKAYKNKKPVYAESIRVKNIPVSYLEISKYEDGVAGVAIATRSGEEYRGKGYASKLVESGKQWFDNQNEFTDLVWDVLSDNEASQKLAEKHGFKKSDMEWDYGDTHWYEYVYKKGEDYVNKVMA